MRVTRTSPRDSSARFDAYVADVVSREALRPMADVRLEAELRHVLRMLAARTAGELIISDVAADIQLARSTVADYVALLETLFLVGRLPGWAASPTMRAKRRPKVLLVDSGLAADLCGVGQADFGPGADGRVAGSLFETFVLAEVAKQVGGAGQCSLARRPGAGLITPVRATTVELDRR